MMPVSASPYTRLVSNWLFPLHERLKGHDSVARLSMLETSQWWDPQRLDAYRRERLRDYLRHLVTRVPYYLSLFNKIGFDPRAVDAVEALQSLPLLDKSTIRQHEQALIASDAGPMTRMATGGSSGEPLRFWVGRDRVSHDVAAKWRATRWWSVDIGDPELVIWGSPIEVGNQDRIRAFRDRLLRSYLVSAFALNDKTLTAISDTIRKRRPAMLFGYPSALADLCEFARLRDIRLDKCGVRVAFVTSEYLFDHQRKLITETLGCPVANGYGGRDAGFIAHECPAGGMHISAEDMIVETVDETGGPVATGEPGELVVTHLANRASPLLRYRTGDIGILDDRQCACGRGLPLLRELQGRSTDFVYASDGTRMHGLALIYILRELPEVRRFKIVQEGLRQITVQLMPNGPIDAALRDRIVADFRRRLGAEVQVDVRCVDDIAAEASGKYRYVISRVSNPVPEQGRRA